MLCWLVFQMYRRSLVCINLISLFFFFSLPIVLGYCWRNLPILFSWSIFTMCFFFPLALQFLVSHCKLLIQFELICRLVRDRMIASFSYMWIFNPPNTNQENILFEKRLWQYLSCKSVGAIYICYILVSPFSSSYRFFFVSIVCSRFWYQLI